MPLDRSSPSVTTVPTSSAPLERESPLRVTGTRAPDLPAPIREPAIPDPARAPAPLDHRLPAHRTKVTRVADELAGLSEDLRDWVELRVQLIKAEIQEKIDGRLSAVKGLAVFGVIAAITGLFGLVTLAVGLGAAFGGRYWLGFLIVNLLLAIGAAVSKRMLAPGAIHVEREKATGKLKISHEETPAQAEAKAEGKPIPSSGSMST